MLSYKKSASIERRTSLPMFLKLGGKILHRFSSTDHGTSCRALRQIFLDTERRNKTTLYEDITYGKKSLRVYNCPPWSGLPERKSIAAGRGYRGRSAKERGSARQKMLVAHRSTYESQLSLVYHTGISNTGIPDLPVP